MAGIAFFDVDSFQLEEGVVATEYERPAPAPDYPIEIHSLNDFDVVSQKSEGEVIDKINLSLSEPLRSVGDVHDRLFRDSDGLWKIERKIGEYTVTGNEYYSIQVRESTTLFSTSSDIGAIKSEADSIMLMNSHLKADVVYTKDEEGVYLNRTGLFRISINQSRISSNSISGLKEWLTANQLRLLFRLATPTIETLNQEFQDKLNNLRSFQDSNYVYTVINDKTDIISGNLKPTLHATFKGGGWYSRWKTEDELRKHQSAIDDKANNSDLDETVRTIETESEKIASLRTDVDITKNNLLITHTDEYINKITTTESSLDGLEDRVVSVEEIKENVDTFFQFDDAFTIGKSNSQTKLRMTNDEIQFLDGETKGTYISGNTMVSQNITIQDKLNLTKHTIETEGDVTVIRFIG